MLKKALFPTLFYSSIGSCVVLFSTSFGHTIKTNFLDKEKYPCPGKIIKNFDIETHYLTNYKENQEKKPSIVFLGDIGETSEAFLTLYNELEKENIVFSYDRPGYGYTSPPITPRHMGNMSIELASLLHKTKIPSPYILVSHGHSSEIVKAFYQKYTDEVAGIIMIDPFHFENLNKESVELILDERQRNTKYKTYTSLGIMEILLKLKTPRLWDDYIKHYPSEIHSRIQYHLRKEDYWKTKNLEIEEFLPKRRISKDEDKLKEKINVPFFIFESGRYEECNRFYTGKEGELNKKLLENGTSIKDYKFLPNKNHINILESLEIKNTIQKICQK